MEKVFKTKRTRNWWIIIVGLVVLIIFLNVYLEKSWAFSALGGIIIPVLMFLFAVENYLYCKRQWCSGNQTGMGEQNMCRRNP